MQSLENKTIGFYHILSLLGRGSSADVYLAQDLRQDRPVACKIVDPGNTWGIECLRQEWDILSMLDHPGIPRPLERMDTAYGEMLVMTHMRGVTPEHLNPGDWVENWKSLSSRARRIAWEEVVLGWSIQVCRILMYLHERPDPLIYGDLKPGNLRLNDRGQIALVDLGTVCFRSLCEERKRQGHSFGGTCGYAAPEQYAEEPGYPVPETDIYSLGKLIEAWMGMAWGIPISEPLRRILDRATALSAEERWSSVREVCYLLQALRKVREGELHLYRIRKEWIAK